MPGTYLVSPAVDGLVKQYNVRHVPVLQRVQLVHVDVLAVLSQLRERLGDAQVEGVALGLGLDDAVAVELQTHAADEAVRLDGDKADLLGPAQLRQRRQLVLRQVCRDNKGELGEELWV